MRIQNSTQDWSIGAIVKVGCTRLRVLDNGHNYDYPDIYTLESLDGRRTYEFALHRCADIYDDSFTFVPGLHQI